MKRLLHPLIFIFLCLLNGAAYCQPSDAVYASSQTNDNPHTGVSSASVDNPQNAITNTISNVNDPSFKKPNSKFTTLKAKALSVVTGSAEAWIQLAFVSTPTDAVVPANTTVYVKATTTAAGLLGLVGGAGLTFTAYPTHTGSDNAIAIAAPKIYYTADGNIYFAVKPTANFKSIRITLTAGAVLGDGSVDIFYAFYGPNQTNDSNPFAYILADCGLPNVSSVETSGTGLTIGNASGAIDANTSTASTFNASSLLGSGTLSQIFHFNGLSNQYNNTANSGDAVRLIFSKGAGAALAVNVDLGAGISIQAYNGSTAVGSSSLFSAIIDADILGLLSTSTQPITAFFTPKSNGVPVQFDRVKVTFSLGLGISLNGVGLNIFDIRRVPDVPVASNVTACTNIGSTLLTALTPQENIAGIGNFVYNWYTVIRDGTSSFNVKSPLITQLTTIGQKKYYVDITKNGCPTASGRKEVTINVVNPPVAPPVALVP